MKRALSAPGPFRAEQVRPGDPYEISQGHAVRLMPTGRDGARGTLTGSLAVATDPLVVEAGIDAGFVPDDQTLRAPDLAIGNVPPGAGFVRGVPPLAIEYAGTGQDETQLDVKIAELLAAGTRWVWVVRVAGVRRVEIHEAGRAPRIASTGDVLEAPGVLSQPVRAEALWDDTVAHEAALRNLLLRRGYAGLDAVREEGREEGREAGRDEGLRTAVLALCDVLAIAVDDERAEYVARASGRELERLLATLRTERRWP